MTKKPEKARAEAVVDDTPESATQGRRAFLKKAGTAAVAAPAATMLLSAKAAKAGSRVSGLRDEF